MHGEELRSVESGLTPNSAYSYELDLFPASEQSSGVNGIVRRWREAAASGDKGGFALKLGLEGLSEDHLAGLERQRCLRSSAREEQSLWIELRHTFRHTAPPGSHVTSEISEVLQEIEIDGRSSFPGLIEPLVELGWRYLVRLQPIASQLSIGPRKDLLHSLAARIIWLSSPTLILELNIARTTGQLAGSDSNERYLHFCRDILCRQYAVTTLYWTYPVLERLTFEAIANWVDFIAEFLERFATDLEELQAQDGQIGTVDAMKEISIDFSDYHKRGKTVVTCAFEDVRILYKPRSLAVDIEYARVLAFISAIQGGLCHRTVWTINKGPYGWQQWVPHQACESEEEVSSYFWRLGSLLALTYALNGGDFHQGNVIANAAHPVLVDLECLLSTPFEIGDHDEHSADGKILRSIERSVAWTGLLPDLLDYESEDAFDLSGLRGIQDREWPVAVPTVKDVQQDSMHYVLEKHKYGVDKNQLILDGAVVDPVDHMRSITEGFRWCYKAILANRSKFMKLLRDFRDTEVRVILRGTQYYALLSSAARHPDFMGDAVERELFFDVMWREALVRDELRSAYLDERRQLHRNDVPFFTARADSAAIRGDSGRATGASLAMAPIDYSLRKLALLGEEDLQLQTAFIVQAMGQSAKPARRDRELNAPGTVPALTEADAEERILCAIRRIASEVEDNALIVAGDIGWLDISDDETGYQAVLGIADDSLYSGIAGISMFLAYASKLGISHDERRCVDLCRQKLLRQLDRPGNRPDWSMFGGQGGTMFALVHLAALLHDPQIIEHLTRLELPAESDWAGNPHHDIIAGHAGTILALLQTFEATGREDFLDLAVRLGHRLVATKEGSEDTCWWVSSEFGVALTGFAHGAGGIAFALHQLGMRANTAVFSNVARKAATFEQRTYDFANAGWPDRRPKPGTREVGIEIAANAWCHGRPGIWLARDLMGGQWFSEAEAIWPEQLIRTAVSSDCLCHGALGNLDIAITLNQRAATKASNVVLLRKAAQIASGILDGTSRSGLRTGISTPGLMLGLSGMGLTLLRCLYPEAVPSILALEGPRHSSIGLAQSLTW